jgi:hypothetical protein
MELLWEFREIYLAKRVSLRVGIDIRFCLDLRAYRSDGYLGGSDFEKVLLVKDKDERTVDLFDNAYAVESNGVEEQVVVVYNWFEGVFTVISKGNKKYVKGVTEISAVIRETSKGEIIESEDTIYIVYREGVGECKYIELMKRVENNWEWTYVGYRLIKGNGEILLRAKKI